MSTIRVGSPDINMKSKPDAIGTGVMQQEETEGDCMRYTSPDNQPSRTFTISKQVMHESDDEVMSATAVAVADEASESIAEGFTKLLR